MSRRLCYDNKQGKEDKTGGKIVPIHQGKKSEDTAARENKARHKNKSKIESQ